MKLDLGPYNLRKRTIIVPILISKLTHRHTYVDGRSVGETLLFDTSLMHDAVNESEEIRYILMLRVWHPDLTPVEREALQFLYDCLEAPGLVSSDPVEQFSASQTVEAMKAFPVLQQNPRGFGGKTQQGKKMIRGKDKGFGA